MDLSKNGKLLRLLRKEKGLTQRQLAEKSEVEPKTVSKWETGRGFPDVSTVSGVAHAVRGSEPIRLYTPPGRPSNDGGENQKIQIFMQVIEKMIIK